MTKLTLGLCAAALVFGWASVSPVAQAGDASAGADVYKSECADCHAIKEGRNKKGPSLFGIVGRKAASVPDYSYSDALHAKSDLTWTPDKLHDYLSQPAKQFIPGTKMRYDGLTDAKQLDDLIAYLSTVH